MLLLLLICMLLLRIVVMPILQRTASDIWRGGIALIQSFSRIVYLNITFDDESGSRQNREIQIHVLLHLFANFFTGIKHFLSTSTICVPKFRVIVSSLALTCGSKKFVCLNVALIPDHVFCILGQRLEFLLVVFWA